MWLGEIPLLSPPLQPPSPRLLLPWPQEEEWGDAARMRSATGQEGQLLVGSV